MGNKNGVYMSNHGHAYCFKNGKLHSDRKNANGKILPAVVRSDGIKCWYTDGVPNRVGVDKNGKKLPVVIFEDGTRLWYENGTFILENGNITGWTLSSVKEHESAGKEHLFKVKRSGEHLWIS